MVKERERERGWTGGQEGKRAWQWHMGGQALWQRKGGGRSGGRRGGCAASERGGRRRDASPSLRDCGGSPSTTDVRLDRPGQREEEGGEEERKEEGRERAIVSRQKHTLL